MEKHLIKEANNFLILHFCIDSELFQNCSPLPQKYLISPPTAILFLHGKVLMKELVCFWSCNQDFASIATELYEKFNRRVLLNIYFRIPPDLFPWKEANFMINCHFVSSWKSIYRKRCSVLDGVIGLCIDCCRIKWGFQHKGSLNLFRTAPF